MKILSLFDGMACGYEALQRAGFKIDKYYASEIDKYAIQIATKNHPDIIEIGDVCEIKGEDYQDIDLLIGGSPCQGFSVAGKMLNFDDHRSKLFFEYVRLLREIKPKYFLLENVKMKKEWQDIISRELGVEPIEINSSLVSAQNRRRLYRTNIPGITQPKDKGILLKDILEDEVDEKYYFSKERWDRIINGKYDIVKRLEDAQKKCNTLTTVGGGNHEKKIAIIQKVGDRDKNQRGVRTDKSYTIPANPMSDRGQMVIEPMIAYAPGSREYYSNGWKTDKSPTICARDYKDPKVVNNGTKIRKITPIECERLQTLPDNYTEGVSDTQRYKMLGNGWTVDVIAHIFSFIPKQNA